MTWFKSDDDAPLNEKFMRLREGPCRADAIALWWECGCWSSKHLRDGFVSNGVILGAGFNPLAPSELVRVGLWEEADGGYVYHDWADYQPSAERVEAKRKAATERKAKSRARLSKPDPIADVGVSQRDKPTVTRESRARRAAAAPMPHGIGIGHSGISDREEEKTYPDTAREAVPSSNRESLLASQPANLPARETRPSDRARVFRMFLKVTGLMEGQCDTDLQAAADVATAARVESGSDEEKFDHVVMRILTDWQNDRNAPPRAKRHLANCARFVGTYARPVNEPVRAIMPPAKVIAPLHVEQTPEERARGEAELAAAKLEFERRIRERNEREAAREAEAAAKRRPSFLSAAGVANA